MESDQNEWNNNVSHKHGVRGRQFLSAFRDGHIRNDMVRLQSITRYTARNIEQEPQSGSLVNRVTKISNFFI